MLMNRRNAIVAAGAALLTGCQSYTEVQRVRRPKGPQAQVKVKNDCDCSPEKPLHICAFHINYANDPAFIAEVDHYCSPLMDGIFQCTLYNEKRLVGVEYVVTDAIYNSLDAEEKKLWHPHKYEIMEGLLIAPELSDFCDEKTMKLLLGTWGKTVHTWPDFKTKLPVGKPVIGWSASVERPIPEELVKERDKRLNVSRDKIKEKRKSYLGEQK